jgi:hypothetical protein
MRGSQVGGVWCCPRDVSSVVGASAMATELYGSRRGSLEGVVPRGSIFRRCREGVP